MLDDGKLRIQGAGLIKVKLHRPVEGEIETVTIKRDLNRWYVCFSVERDSVRLPESSEEIAMDGRLAAVRVAAACIREESQV